MTEQNGRGRSSATDELRAMLSERGVEWMPVAWNPQRETFYRAANGVGFCADEYTDGVRIYTDATITPEQAIAATLGRTCHDTGESRVFHCSTCGFGLEDAYVEDEHAYPPEDFPRFCPSCGAEVVKQ